MASANLFRIYPFFLVRKQIHVSFQNVVLYIQGLVSRNRHKSTFWLRSKIIKAHKAFILAEKLTYDGFEKQAPDFYSFILRAYNQSCNKSLNSDSDLSRLESYLSVTWLDSGWKAKQLDSNWLDWRKLTSDLTWLVTWLLLTWLDLCIVTWLLLTWLDLWLDPRVTHYNSAYMYNASTCSACFRMEAPAVTRKIPCNVRNVTYVTQFRRDFETRGTSIVDISLLHYVGRWILTLNQRSYVS